MEDLIEKYQNANELQLEEACDRQMKDAYVDQFTELFKNNLIFCYNLIESDLGQRVLEIKERLLNLEERFDNEESDLDLLLYAVILSREYIEALFYLT